MKCAQERARWVYIRVFKCCSSYKAVAVPNFERRGRALPLGGIRYDWVGKDVSASFFFFFEEGWEGEAREYPGTLLCWGTQL